jgi:hypothetical protein
MEGGIMTDNPKHPHPGMPAIFSDGVESMTNNSEVVKFYLARFDPDIQAVGPSEITTVAQVIMPISAFIQTALFFDLRLERLIAEGKTTSAEIDRVRAEHRATYNDRPAN